MEKVLSKIASAFAFALAGILIIASTSFAQNGAKSSEYIAKAKERYAKQTERLTKELKLSGEQVKKFNEINDKAIAKLEEQKDKPKENRVKPKDINEDRIIEFKTILTKEQKEKFEAIREKMKEKAKERLNDKEE
jgi:ABC-type transport system involved in cytochrome bd biosynthesis fused ATPase/permease subunit